MRVLNRIIWLLYSKIILSKKGIKAHLLSYCNKDTILEGNNVLGKGVHLNSCTIGKYTYIVNGSITKTKIGRYCSIGQNVIIGGLGAHPTEWISTHPIFFSTKKQAGKTFVDKDYFVEQKAVRVGNDVWIGANALVLDGVSINDGAIVAAGAVVTKDVPSYAIVGGVPAKIIRYRFSKEIREKLIEIQWWNMEEKEIIKFKNLFLRDNFDLKDLELMIK